jgi:hypothetical protein
MKSFLRVLAAPALTLLLLCLSASSATPSPTTATPPRVLAYANGTVQVFAQDAGAVASQGQALKARRTRRRFR